jgi:hypothetical protein
MTMLITPSILKYSNLIVRHILGWIEDDFVMSIQDFLIKNSHMISYTCVVLSLL